MISICPPARVHTPRTKKKSVPLLARKFLPSPGHGNAFPFPPTLEFFHSFRGAGGISGKTATGNRIFWISGLPLCTTYLQSLEILASKIVEVKCFLLVAALPR